MGLLRGSWTEAKRSWSWFTGHFKVHSLNWDMYAYYPMHGWAWLLPGPLAYDAADKIKPNGPVADSSGYQAISRFVAGTMVSKSATWVSAGVLKNGSPQSWAVPGSQSFHKGIYLFIYLFIYLLIYLFLWLCWVFVSARGLSLVAASEGYSLLRYAGFSLQWLLLRWSTGSRHTGFSSCGIRAQ